jgi:mono/diheme cytochrome c family protein
MKKCLLLGLAFVLVKLNYAQTPTWSADIAPMMFQNCTSCHHDGGLAPFSLTTFSGAYANRIGIIDAVSTGNMPPWPPSPDYRHFKGERYLTNAQITKINAWISGGAPSGDTTTAPPAPTYSNASELPSVSATLTMPTYTVPNYPGDLYVCFVVPNGLTQDEFITAIEVIPGNAEIVHHVLIYEDTSSTHDAAAKDAGTIEPGYLGFGGPGVNKANLIGGWVPGTRPNIYPNGMGVKLHKNRDIIMQMHYPYGSAGKTDSTKINLRLSTGALREIYIAPPLNHAGGLVNGPLYIPANTTKTFEAQYTIPNNIPIQGVSLLDVGPHAHLICTDWLVFAKTPSGDTIPLIKIDNWDFHWQGFYTFQKLQFVPKGSTFFGFATYDNTANNPHNPSSPPANVSVGEATTDEMMLVYFSYLLYQPGDENMILDSTIIQQPTGIISPDEAMAVVTTPQLYDAVPNPANNETSISYYMPTTANAELQILDINGRLVEKREVSGQAGMNNIIYNTSTLPTGNYFINLVTGGQSKTKKLVVNR